MDNQIEMQNIPENPVIEKSVIPSFADLPVNLAGDENVSKPFLSWAKTQFEFFRSQEERSKFVSGKDGSLGTMDLVDRMYRCSLNRDESDDQYQDTLSNVTSTAFFKAQRILSSSLNTIYLSDKDLPVVYEPDANCGRDVSTNNAKQVSEYYTLLAENTMDEDKRREKIKELVNWTLAYGNWIVSDEWERIVDKRRVRVPGYYDAQGNPVELKPDEQAPMEMYDQKGDPIPSVFEGKEAKHFITIEKEFVIKDCPSLMVHDMKDCFFDATIDDEKMWRCFIRLGKVPYENLVARQASGELQNVDKITPTHLTINEDPEDILDQRNTNDGGSTSLTATGLVPIFHVWGVVPIKEGKKRGKGKWDAAKTIPEMWWGMFAGDISASGNCVPLLISKSPYPRRGHPYKMIHSHRDNKGAFHAGTAERVESLYWELVTNRNQLIDNKNEIVRAPWVTDGPIKGPQDLTFKPDRLIKIGKGTKLERIKVDNTTQLTIPLEQLILNDFMETAGANKTLQAQALGSRTSALEAKQVQDSALLPLDDLASYIGDQLFTWMFESDAEMWDLFGDPNRTMMVTHMGEVKEVRPLSFWGPVKTRVTCVSRFKNNIIRRQELNAFMQTQYPLLAPELSRDDKKLLWKYLMKEQGIAIADQILNGSGDYDAFTRAVNAGNRLLMGQWVEPRPEENHQAWLNVLEPMLAEYLYLPETDQNETGIRNLQAHIQIRKNILQQNEQRTKMLMAGQSPAQSEIPTVGGMPNEGAAAMNPIEAQEGAMANV